MLLRSAYSARSGLVDCRVPVDFGANSLKVVLANVLPIWFYTTSSRRFKKFLQNVGIKPTNNVFLILYNYNVTCISLRHCAYSYACWNF